MTLNRSVAQYIAHYGLLRPGERVLVALSGGADSVCLLCLLRELGYVVEAAHCNFHLRGQESDRDECFCKDLCERLSVPLHIRPFDTRQYARQHGLSIEMAARELRYGWFHSLAHEQGIRRIAVAHHRDDNVETLLNNLIRGTGLRGLCAMQPLSADIIRPLLDTPRAAILHYLQDIGQTYVTDSTNLSDQYTRNRIRLSILPQMQALNPAATDNIARTISHLREALRVYDYTNEQFAAAALDSPDALDKATILRAPSPQALLHTLLAPLGFRSAQMADILAHIDHTGATFLSFTHALLVDRTQLIISNRNGDTDYPVNIPMPQQGETVATDIPQGTLRLTIIPQRTADSDPNHAFLDADTLREPLTARTPKAGDRFQPLGMAGTQLISDFLTNRHLPRTKKEKQPLLLAGDNIVWVVGQRIAHPFRLTPHTQRVLFITYEPSPTAQEGY